MASSSDDVQSSTTGQFNRSLPVNRRPAGVKNLRIYGVPEEVDTDSRPESPASVETTQTHTYSPTVPMENIWDTWRHNFPLRATDQTGRNFPMGCI
ncbi:hypothetical protein UPYG_G00088370, partial [Umbra pygmaea]